MGFRIGRDSRGLQHVERQKRFHLAPPVAAKLRIGRNRIVFVRLIDECLIDGGIQRARWRVDDEHPIAVVVRPEFFIDAPQFTLPAVRG